MRTHELSPETDRVLRGAALFYALGTVLHTADHYRRGVDVVTLHVHVAGTLGLILATVAITLIMVRHELAPYAALAVGLPHALGISLVHLAPRWSAFSDSFADGPVSPVTWAAVLVEIAGGLATAAAGAYALTRGRDVGAPSVVAT